MPAKIPVRKPDNDLHGLAPAPGWDARYDWAGFIPFDQLPRSFNPRAGKIVTANHKIVPPGYRYAITYEWDAPYRANRIDQLLEGVKKHDMTSGWIWERRQAEQFRNWKPREQSTGPQAAEGKARASSKGLSANPSELGSSSLMGVQCSNNPNNCCNRWLRLNFGN